MSLIMIALQVIGIVAVVFICLDQFAPLFMSTTDGGYRLGLGVMFSGIIVIALTAILSVNGEIKIQIGE